MQFLQGVIVQGFLQILDPEVTIHVREADAAAAKQAADAASKQYTEISGRQVKYELVTSLSPDLYVEQTLCDIRAHGFSVVLVA